MSDVQALVERYRGVREALERAVLPLATSVDGRRFSFQTSLQGLELEAGGYVTLDGGGSSRLGDDSIRSIADLERFESDSMKLRARNLGVDRWGIWPGSEAKSLAAELDDAAGPRCIVVDLGSLAVRDEQAVTAGTVLERLWRRRSAHQPDTHEGGADVRGWSSPAR